MEVTPEFGRDAQQTPLRFVFTLHVHVCTCIKNKQRAFKVRQAQRGHSGIVEADEDSGPMLDADADAFIHGGFD